MLSNLLDIGISMYDFLLRIANGHYQVVATLNKIGGGGLFFKFNIGAHILFWIILEFNWCDEFINFEDMPTQSFVGAHRDRIAHVYLYE